MAQQNDRLAKLPAIQHALSGTRFNRDLVALRQQAEDFAEALERFHEEHDPVTVWQELKAMGLVTSGEYDEDLIDAQCPEAESAPQDAWRFLWVLQMFISFLEAVERPVPNHSADEESSPCVVVGGKDGGA